MVFCEFVSLFFRLPSPLAPFIRYYYSLPLRLPVHVYSKTEPENIPVGMLCRGTRVQPFIFDYSAKVQTIFILCKENTLFNKYLTFVYN